MNISQPFKGVPLWEFNGLDIPDIDLYSYRNVSAQESKPVMSAEIYKKRTVIENKDLSHCEKYVKVESQIKDVIAAIQKQSTEMIYVEDGEYKTLLLMQGAWNMRNYKNIEFIMDKKGFNMGYHLDNRNIKCNLFLNLKDNISSTEFMILNRPFPWTHESYVCDKKEWKAPSQKGSGYFYFNEDRLWHKIEVEDDERLIAMMGVTME